MSNPLPVFLTGLSLGATLIVAIGAQNAHVLRQGLRREHVGAVVAVCALLDLLLMAAGVGGVAAALGERPGWLAALSLGGALLLALYGAAAWRRALRPASLQATPGASLSLRGAVARTLAVSLLNPHVYLDTVVLVGAVGARQPEGTQAAFVAGAGLASMLWFGALGFGARALAPLFARPAAWRWLDAAVGGVMFAIALQLVLNA